MTTYLLPRGPWLVLVLGVVLLAGCFHVAVPPAPSPQAPSSERVAAYQRLRPAAEVHDISIIANRYGASVNVTSSLVLADGTSIRHADDLLPALAATTAASRAAERSADARRQKIGWIIGGTVTMMASGMFMLASTEPGSVNGLALAGLTAGALATTIGGLYFGHVEQAERLAAFATYDASLRESLRLCVDGLQITDCAAQAGSQTTAAAH
jgi:hypothetical protein